MLQVLEDDTRTVAWHEQLPLVATLSGDPGLVTIWSSADDRLVPVGQIGDRTREAPRIIGGILTLPTIKTRLDWHPTQPLLALGVPARAIELWHVNNGGLVPDAPSKSIGTRVEAAWDIGFTSDGAWLWVDPSAETTGSALLHLEGREPPSLLGRMDTVVVRHPERERGLHVTLQSNQGATLMRFVTISQDGRTVAWRRTRILQADRYRNLTFSPSGDRFAFTGNAYESAVWVHDFPSLRQAYALELPSRAQTLCPFTPDGQGLLVALPTGSGIRGGSRERSRNKAQATRAWAPTQFIAMRTPPFRARSGTRRRGAEKP